MDNIDQIKNDILQAYAEATAISRGDWYMLSGLREDLGRWQRGDVDRALIELHREDRIELVPENNQKALRPQDWSAALWLGGQWKHVMTVVS